MQKEFVDLLLGSPLLLHQLLPWLAKFLPHNPVFFLLASFVCILLTLSFGQLVTYLGTREAIVMQQILAKRLYRQMLELRSDTLSGKPLGEVVALYTTDIPGATILLEQSVPQGTSILFPLILGPTAIVLLFNIPVLPMLLMIFVIVLVNFIMAKRQSVFFYFFKRFAADRIGLVNEWIQNIRSLRILGWVPAFEQKIFDVRQIETTNRIRMLNNGQTMNAIASSVTFLMNIACISMVVNISPGPVSPGSLLALLWIVGIFLTRPFRQMPWFFTFVFDAWTSLTRVQALLRLKNQKSALPSTTTESPPLEKRSESSPGSIQVKGLNLELQGQKILKNIDLEIAPGEFLAIVGKVGSGKSQILLSLLGETPARFEKYLINGKEAPQMSLKFLRSHYAFVPQEGFIMSSTLRDNVGFDYDLPKSHDVETLESLRRCQFESSNERLEQGLDTEIGERGVNLSGGQRQRVSLARADYFKSSVILMDDCLSAVDVDTEAKLVSQLFKGAWKNCTRILVTHRLSILPQVDRILFLESGRIVDQGRWQDLMAHNQAFRDYAASVGKAPAEQVSQPKTESTVIEPSVTSLAIPLADSEGSDL